MPRLSPDGNSIAALSEKNHVVLLDVKTAKIEELTSMTCFFPGWSGDGRYVYFSSTGPDGISGLYRVQVKGRKVELVVSFKDIKRPTSISWGNWTGLAPDGSPLALRDISSYEIYAFDWQHP